MASPIRKSTTHRVLLSSAELLEFIIIGMEAKGYERPAMTGLRLSYSNGDILDNGAELSWITHEDLAKPPRSA